MHIYFRHKMWVIDLVIQVLISHVEVINFKLEGD